MAVTEVTRFRLRPGAATTDSTLCAKLRTVRDRLQGLAGNKRFVNWFQQTEDPSYIYIICEETTASELQQQVLPSESSKECLELL
jgi:hypothetical protein